jgi:hypothetical protein
LLATQKEHWQQLNEPLCLRAKQYHHAGRMMRQILYCQMQDLPHAAMHLTQVLTMLSVQHQEQQISTITVQ